MLILTRRPQETIRVGADVTITVLGVEGGKVRIGITAPRDVAVDRQEIYERKRRETAPGERQSPEPAGSAHDSCDGEAGAPPHDRLR